MKERLLNFFKKDLSRFLCLLCLIFIFSFSLSSCSNGASKVDNYTLTKVQYNPSEDGTLVTYQIKIDNTSIYNMENVSLTFDLFANGEYLKTSEPITIETSIHHGESKSYTSSFLVRDTIVDASELTSISTTYLSFAESYLTWIIVFSVITLVATISYLVYIFYQDVELDEVWFDLTDLDYSWVIIIIPILLGGTFSSIIPVATIGWVPLCLFLGSLGIFIIIALIGHLFHDVIGLGSSYTIEEAKAILNQLQKKEKPKENKNQNLENYTKAQLIEYCKEQGIGGYSSLNKQDLISLIKGSEGQTSSNKVTKSSVDKKITFDSIAGLEEAKEAFKEKVIMPFMYPEIFEKYHKKSGGGILLYGLPGTGKTMFAEAASNEVDALFIPIKCSDIKSKWYGESEQKVNAIFSKARKAKRAIIFFDEFEAIGSKRTDDSENSNNDLVTQILSEMQGVGSSNHSTIVVIAATNKPWSIDTAFLRPGRFDEKIYIPLPDYEARLKLLNINLQDLPKEDNLNLSDLAKFTEGFNGADIKELCEKLKMEGIKKSLNQQSEYQISNNDIEKVKEIVHSSVSKEDIERLEEFKIS